MQTNLIKPSARGYERIAPGDILFNDHRMIYMNGEVNPQLTEEVIYEMIALDRAAPGERILLGLNGPGGMMDLGYAVIDVMQMLESPVYTVAFGLAASMDALILAAGEPGHRYVLPHARVMIHEPISAGGVSGSATSILRTSESIMKIKKMSCEMLSAWTGRSYEEVEKAVSFNNYMSAEEAVEFGLCDRIVSSISELF